MIDRNKIRQYTPTLLFLVGYTALFGLVCLTFQYTFPFLMGFLLALLLQPFMRLLNGRLHFKKSLASLCATLLLYLLLFGLLFWAGAALVNEISELLQKLSSMDFGPLRNAVEDALSRLRSFIGEIDADFISQNKDQILSIASAGVSVVAAVLSWAVKFLTSIPAIFTMFFDLFYLLFCKGYAAHQAMPHVPIHGRNSAAAGFRRQARRFHAGQICLFLSGSLFHYLLGILACFFLAGRALSRRAQHHNRNRRYHPHPGPRHSLSSIGRLYAFSGELCYSGGSGDRLARHYPHSGDHRAQNCFVLH